MELGARCGQCLGLVGPWGSKGKMDIGTELLGMGKEATALKR